MADFNPSPPTRPYLIRALHEWCSDNGFTPYLSVAVDASVQVPLEYVKDGEIVLNVSYDASTDLKIGNEYLTFKARFSGVVREIMVPIDRVLAIFAKENGQGMAFPKADRLSLGDASKPNSEVQALASKPTARPTLTRIK